jgi:hypothetical protein
MPFYYKFYAIWILTKSLSCSCSPEVKNSDFKKGKSLYDVSEIGEMPRLINESSGLVANADGSLWTHNDSGGASEIYRIDAKGNLLETKAIQAQNTDWEDICKDKSGTIFIGDFGNNAQNRRDLCVYKIGNDKTEKISFQYGNQTVFDTENIAQNYDCEAFFWFKNKLYLFSKNWAKKDKGVKLYELPETAGNFTLYPKDSIYIKAQVTAASVNPAGTEFALMTYGKLFFFGIENNEINFKKPLYCIKISKKQTEAIAYINDTDLILSNEQRDLFLVKKNKK